MLIPYLWSGHQKYFQYVLYNLAFIVFIIKSFSKADLKVVPVRLDSLILAVRTKRKQTFRNSMRRFW